MKPSTAKSANPKESIVIGSHAILSVLQHDSSRAKKLYIREKAPSSVEIVAAAKKAGIQILAFERDQQLLKEVLTLPHQGAFLMCSPFPYLDFENALSKKPKLVLILDGVVDPRNLGRCARSAWAFGVDLLVLPKDNCADITPVAEKAAVGALSQLKVAKVGNLVAIIEKLKKAGFWVVAAEADAKNPIHTFDFPSPLAVIVGGEDSGVRQLVQKNCDALVCIPMAKSNFHFNAADAAAIVLYEIHSRESPLKAHAKTGL